MNDTPDETGFICPHCAARLRPPAGAAVRAAACPSCGREVGVASQVGSTSGSGECPTAAATLPEESAHVATSCPDCGTGLRVRSKYVGRHVRCGNCRSKFLVEPPAAAASVLDAPRVASADLDRPAPTPDPDDPWQGRAEVLRLLDEIAKLRGRNQRLSAQVERLERERDAALRELARERQAGAGYGAPFDVDVEAHAFALLEDAADARGR